MRRASKSPTYTCTYISIKIQVTFKVSKTATSLLVFGAFVWKAENKLKDATPVTVS